jgi:hypothetical protein
MEQKMNPNGQSGVNREEERVINIKKMFLSAARHWRSILIAGILLGLLLGGYKFLGGLRASRDTTGEQALETYNSQKKSLETQLKSEKRKLEDNAIYQKESVIQNMDAHDYYAETISYYITTNYQIDPKLSMQNPDYSDSVIGAYASAVNDGELYDYVMDKMTTKIKRRYLQELVKTKSDMDSNILTIYIVGPNQSTVKEIADLFKNGISSKKAEITEQVATHDISIVSDSLRNTADNDVDVNKSNNNSSDDSNSGITETNFVLEAQKAYESSIQSIQTSINDLNNQQSNLKEPEVSQITKKNAAKNAVRYGVIGLIAGILLLILCWDIHYVHSSTAEDFEELKKRQGIRILGEYRPEVPRRAFHRLDALIDRIEGIDPTSRDLNQVYGISAAKIQNELADSGIDQKSTSTSAVLIGTVSKEDLDTVRENLLKTLSDAGLEPIRIISGGNILNDAEAIRILGAYTNAVIVERKNQSQRAKVSEEILMVRDMGKNIIGLISL